MASVSRVFLRGSFAALSLAWGALGGAVGLAVMVAMEGWLPIPIGIAIGGYVALYIAYHNAENARADGETALFNLKRSHARDVEWQRAIETFQGLWDLDIDAVLTKTTRSGVTTESWGFHLFNSKGDYEAHVRACEMACQVAGHALAQSKVFQALPLEISAHTDPLDLWLRFVVSKDGFGGMVGSGYDNTGPERIESESQNISEIQKKSKRLCEYCRNNELIL